MGDALLPMPRIVADGMHQVLGRLAPEPLPGENVRLPWFSGGPDDYQNPALYHDVLWTFDGTTWTTATPIVNVAHPGTTSDRHAEGNREMALLLERDEWRELALDMATWIAGLPRTALADGCVGLSVPDAADLYRWAGRIRALKKD